MRCGLLLSLLAVSACPAPLPVQCHSDSDCTSDRICYLGYCVFPDDPDSSADADSADAKDGSLGDGGDEAILNGADGKSDGAVSDGGIRDNDAGLTDGSSPDVADFRACATDYDCTAGKEVCLPSPRICAPTCSTPSDCTTNRCTLADGLSLLVCRCSSNSECGTTVCHSADHVCEPKCTKEIDCSIYFPGRICNTLTGECTIPKKCAVGQIDCPTNQPACVGGICAACNSDSQCAGRPDGHLRCSSGACVRPELSCDPGNLIPGAGDGPDTCNYGEACETNICRAIARSPTCDAATNFPGEWDPSIRGPVIVSAAGQGFSASSTMSECVDGGPKVEIAVAFYSPTGWSYGSYTDALAGRVTTIRPNGSSASPAFFRNLPASGSKSGSFVVGCCGTSSYSGRAIFLTDSSGNTGNIACVQ